MRTFDTRPVDPNSEQNDITGGVTDRLRALSQRIDQRLKFPLGTWDLDTTRGTPSVLGRVYTPELAAAVLTNAIRDEGGAEVTGVETEVEYERSTRRLIYSATVSTIYGTTTIAGTAV